MKSKTKKLLMILPIVFLFLIGTTCFTIWKLNTYHLELNISERTITLEYGVDKMPEITAVCKGSLLQKKGTPVELTIKNEPDLQKLGTYEVEFTAEYRKVTLSQKRTFIVQDTIAPEIALVSNPEHYTSPATTYEEEGFTATDNYDGDITSQVARAEKDGIVTYTVTDSSGNAATVERKIIYKDTVAPAITLNGQKRIYLQVGGSYAEPGYAASDDIDGDITKKVTISGGVDTSKMGINTITYSVADNAGNTTTATRSVYVYQQQKVANPVNPGSKVVYLTFDDGPSKHTATLLNILDKYNVKATFFVTNQFPAYQNMIGETHRRGHTIALHTYTHRYNVLYQSETAYYEDLEAIKTIAMKETGTTPTIVRFPGGTSNTVSKKYCQGIMSTLAESLSYHGFLYCDWNVSSGDAGGVKTTSGVANNVISGIQKHDVSVVLQHDITSYSVQAVEDILFWGIQNGYTFLPMTDTTPMVHFKPMN